MWNQDWNGNGKYDVGDRFLDYQIYQQVTKDNKKSPKYNRQSTEHSGLAGLSAFMAIFMEGLIFALFQVNIDTVPGFVLIVIWFICWIFIFEMLSGVRPKDKK